MANKFVSTQKILCEHLGITQQALAKSWVHKEGWPGKSKRGYNVQKCMEFIRSYKEAQRLKKETGPHADLKERKLEAECKILDEKLNILRRDTIPMDEHLAELAQHAAIVKAVFKQWIEQVKAVGGVKLIKEANRLSDMALARLRAMIGDGEGA